MPDDMAKNVPERLLDTAEKLFCEKGYQQTSVRDLTNAADCNIASVNYHFGGKDKLYAEMFRRYFGNMVKVQTENIDKVMNSSEPTLEKLINAVVHKGLESVREGNPENSMLRLLVRENLNPQMPNDIVPHDIYKDLERYFIESIIKLTPGINRQDAILSRFSLDGVMVFSILFTEYYYKLFPDMTADKLQEHIVKFTCAGIRAFSGEK